MLKIDIKAQANVMMKLRFILFSFVLDENHCEQLPFLEIKSVQLK